jgi:DNA-binding transcriptional ArsR family regulator
MSDWTFLTNHALVLSYMWRHPRTTARELGDAIGITERATRRIIADLDEAGYIVKKREGRRNRYRVNTDLPLRHETNQETAVGDLLQALAGKRKRQRAKPR